MAGPKTKPMVCKKEVLKGICGSIYMGQFSNDLDNDNDNNTWNNASIDS